MVFLGEAEVKRERKRRVGKRKENRQLKANYRSYLQVAFLLSEVKGTTQATPCFTLTFSGDWGRRKDGGFYGETSHQFVLIMPSRNFHPLGSNTFTCHGQEYSFHPCLKMDRLIKPLTEGQG